jgi:hypothetical protein
MTIQETTAQPATHPYRTAPNDALGDNPLRVPYRSESRMRLAVSSGLAHSRIVIDPAAQDLIAIQCGEGPPPRLRAAIGEIGLSWRSSFGEWLRDALRPRDRDIVIVLHPAVEWTLAIRGGLAHVELALSTGTVARIDINGGCSDVRFELPMPTTTMPIRIAGGASQLDVVRPAQTGFSLAVSGGIAALRLDDQRFDAIGGSTRLESHNNVPGAPRYELQVNGGASDLAIECRELGR